MVDEGDPWSVRLPRLFRESYVDYADALIRYTTDPVPDHLVSRLHLVATTAEGHVVVCRSEEGGRFLPGGTREPAESLEDLAGRELAEEAGSVLEGPLRPFAAHEATSRRDRPFRPHLPHPRAYWSYATARVRVVGAPTNPDDGEKVVEVLALPPDEAVHWIAVHDPIHADVLRHALGQGLIPRAAG
jgi:8-oxo-dGTP diphosphatase